MAAGTSACLCMTLLSVVLSVSAGQTNIPAEPGQTVSLPCKALNKDPVTVVEWRRTDLKEDEYVLLYRDKRFVDVNQHPSYKNRVDLQDRQMKDGDVSLILKNVTIEDRGTYECRAVHNKTTRRKRDTGPTVIKLTVVPEKRNIPADPGQTVSLPCKALNNDPVIYVEWRRTDLKEDEYVLLYRDNQLDPENQHPSYKNRVDLQDRQMKDGDVSLILNNVTIEDRGTYECYINQREKNIIKKFVDPISIITVIRLEVDSGHTAGHQEDGGDKQGGDKDGSVGLIVGLIVGGVLVGSVVGFLIYRRYRHRYHPPPEQSADPQQL